MLLQFSWEEKTEIHRVRAISGQSTEAINIVFPCFLQFISFMDFKIYSLSKAKPPPPPTSLNSWIRHMLPEFVKLLKIHEQSVGYLCLFWVHIKEDELSFPILKHDADAGLRDGGPAGLVGVDVVGGEEVVHQGALANPTAAHHHHPGDKDRTGIHRGMSNYDMEAGKHVHESYFVILLTRFDLLILLHSLVSEYKKCEETRQTSN